MFVEKICNKVNFTALKMLGNKGDLVASMQLLNDKGLLDTFEKRCEEIHKKSSESNRDVYLKMRHFKDVGVVIETKTKDYGNNCIQNEAQLFLESDCEQNEGKINNIFDEIAKNIDTLDKKLSGLRTMAYDSAINKAHILYARYAHITSLEEQGNK